MGRLGAEHDHVGVGAQLVGVPAAVGDAAEHLQQAPGLDASGPGDAVLAVGGHQVVLLTGGVAGTDLRGLLAQEIGSAHARTPVTWPSPMPASAATAKS